MDFEAPVERGDAVGQAAQAGPDLRVGAADAVVADLDHGEAVVARDPHAACAARAYFVTLVSDSATTK